MSQEKIIKIRELYMLLSSRQEKVVLSPTTIRIKLHELEFVLVNEPRDVLSIYYRTAMMTDFFIYRVHIIGDAFCVSERKSPSPVEGTSWEASKHYFSKVIDNVIGRA